METFKKNAETGEWEKEVWVFEYDALDRRVSKGRLKAENSKDILDSEITFLWDGSRLLQEHNSDGLYTYLYTDADSYEPLAQIHNYTNTESESRQEINYFHCDQIGIPREMTDKDGKLLWLGEYNAWGKLTKETNVTGRAHQPFRLQNQYCDSEIRLHYNFFRYYDSDVGRFVNQDPIGLLGGDNSYRLTPNIQIWIDPLGLCPKSTLPNADKAVIDPKKIKGYALNTEHPVGGNKAKVFQSALGFNQSNADELIEKIQQGVCENPATLGKCDEHGQRYTVDIPMTGPNGKTATVRTGWIIDSGKSIPRLTTTYVL